MTPELEMHFRWITFIFMMALAAILYACKETAARLKRIERKLDAITRTEEE